MSVVQDYDAKLIVLGVNRGLVLKLIRLFACFFEIKHLLLPYETIII